MFTIDNASARFATFAQAADCAVKHAQQRGPALIRSMRAGDLLADFRAMPDGTVSCYGIGERGRALVDGWAR